MSLTALAWLLGFCVAAIVTWSNPVYGLLGVMLEYYQRPSLQWWGDNLPRLRWNLIVTVIFAASVIAKRSRQPQVADPDRTILTLWALFALNLVFVNIVFPVNTAFAQEWGTYWLKVAIMMPILLAMVLKTPRAIDLFILANIIGVGWWGWESFIDPKREAARLIGVGSGDTYNDNAAAIHLLLILPLIGAMIATAKKIERYIAIVALPLVINTLILCNSRGAMLGLGVSVALAPLLARRGHRGKALIFGLVIPILVLLLGDPQFFKRQQGGYDDGSAQGRLEAWGEAGRILSDHPLGTGARGFHLLIPKYSANIALRHDGEPRSPHNTMILVMVEYGVQGITLWVLLLLAVFRMLLRTRRMAIEANDDFAYYRSVALVIALAGALTGGMFTDRLYSEGIYWIIAMGIALNRLVAYNHSPAAVLAAAPVTRPPNAAWHDRPLQPVTRS